MEYVMNEACEPCKETEVSSQLNHLRNNLAELETLVGSLDGGLSEVLRVEDPACDKACDPPQECLVPVANQLRIIRNRVCALNGCVQSILSRLEV
jgi:hypothetical protein